MTPSGRSAPQAHPSAGIDIIDDGVDAAVLDEVLAGMQSPEPWLPCKFFYDARGSDLFEKICQQPEYYLTRTEIGLLRQQAAAIAAAVGPGVEVIEFGSGSGFKTRLLLESLPAVAGLTLIDISASALAESVDHLRAAYPDLAIRGMVGDYHQALRLPSTMVGGRRLIFFPGSTIGNETSAGAVAFLRRMRLMAGQDGLLLLGTDLVKDVAVLEAAYNDAAGVTAAFNRNVLVHCNRLFDGDCRAAAFHHRAVFDPVERRIDLSLVADSDQHWQWGGVPLALAAGEAIHTEHSHKYRPADVDDLAERGGWRTAQRWIDAQGWFALSLLA